MNRRLSFFRLFVCLSACGLLGACAGSDTTAALTPPPVAAPAGPGEAELMLKIRDYIARQKGPAHSRYEYSLVDLNGDGRREGIVYFTLPYNYWCGWGGCTLAIFAANPDAFVLASEITNVRGPIVVSNNTSHGWRDIVLRVSGTSMSDRNVAMRFDGDSYPVNPLGESEIAQWLGDIPGDRLFP